MENAIHFIKPNPGSGNELKRCPFCGSDEVVFMQYEHTAGPRWKVFCCGCTAMVDTGYAQNPHVVADLWNQREAEQGERDNQPLSIYELEKMSGEPVYIDDEKECFHGWELSEDAADYFEGRDVDNYGFDWVAYRHKPKGA